MVLYTHLNPQIQNYQLLKNNILRNNLTNIILYNNACGDIKEIIKMPYINNCSFNMGDLTPNYIYSDYTLEQCIKLDDLYLPNINIIKIDVQGWEKKVLIGSIELLKKK